MHLCVNSAPNWISENGFKFSPSKTVCMHFCRQNGFFPEPTILLDKSPSKVVKKATFLGLILTPNLPLKSTYSI